MKNIDSNTLSDVMNGDAYTYEQDVLHLILFADAASYNKSGNRSQLFVFSAIAEMPYNKRYRLENVIFHSSWSGSKPDFNTFLEKYNGEIDVLIKNGINVNNTHYRFKVLIFIADAPCRSEGCFCSSFNGKYGCIKCLHPTIYTTKTIYPKLETVKNWKIEKKDKDGNVIKVTQPFKDLQSINLRSKRIYNEQVLQAMESHQTCKGIKGYSYLSEWVDIPRMVIYDKMHMTDIGTFKSYFNLLLDTNKEDYSLGEKKNLLTLF